MKNRVILNGQGIPVVPKSEKIAAQVAESDIRAQFRKLAFTSFGQGVDAFHECMTLALNKAKEAGHNAATIDDTIRVVDEIKKICHQKVADQ